MDANLWRERTAKMVIKYGAAYLKKTNQEVDSTVMRRASVTRGAFIFAQRFSPAPDVRAMDTRSVIVSMMMGLVSYFEVKAWSSISER